MTILKVSIQPTLVGFEAIFLLSYEEVLRFLLELDCITEIGWSGTRRAQNAHQWNEYIPSGEWCQ